MDITKLFYEAKKARQNAYSPYSNYMVGACLKTKSGKLYTGCNIENEGIMAICAERVAFCKALSEGEREFEEIAIVGAYKTSEKFEECTPCGYCRQFMNEFVDKDFKIHIISETGSIKTFTIDDILPYSFKLS